MSNATENILNIIFVQPNLLPPPSLLGERVVVIDISFALPIAPEDFPLNHPNTDRFYDRFICETTFQFIKQLGNRLLLWIDHHPHRGWKKYENDPRFILDSSKMVFACAQLVKPDLFRKFPLELTDTILCHNDVDGVISAARFIQRGRLPYPKALHDAITSDTRQGRFSTNGHLLDQMLKINRDETTCHLALQWLINKDKTAYQQLNKRTKSIQSLKKSKIVYHDIGNCRIFDARKESPPFDLTNILCNLQKDGHIGIVIHEKSNEEFIDVAAIVPGINLPHILHLPGGSAQRVVLAAAHLSDVVNMINESLDWGGIQLPRSATIEIVRRCNLSCRLCPAGTGQARQFPDMDSNVFCSLIDKFAPVLNFLTLSNYGEPMLHPKLCRLIHYAKSAGISWVELTTNGNVLPPGLAQGIVNSGLDAIRFSVDTADDQAYQKYRINGNLKMVLDNMQRLRKIRDKLGFKTPQIEAQALVMSQNEDKIDRFEMIVRRFGADMVRFKTFNTFMCGDEKKDKGLSFLPATPEHRRYLEPVPQAAVDQSQISSCRWPWDRLVVLADGTIVPCCHDFNGEFPLGSIIGADVSSIWNTSQRRSFMVRRIYNPMSIHMCRRCSSAVKELGVRKLVKLPQKSNSNQKNI